MADLKHEYIRRISQLESYSNRNIQQRYFEEQERIPMETDEAELHKLEMSFFEMDDPQSNEALQGIETATSALSKQLQSQHKKRRKLLVEKSHLTAETEKQRIAARFTVKRVGRVKLNMQNQQKLEKMKLTAKHRLKRLDANYRLLTVREKRPHEKSSRRAHVRSLMLCDAKAADQYERGLGMRMLWAQRSFTYKNNYKNLKASQEGEVKPQLEYGRFFYRSINVKEIATPVDEEGYMGDDGSLSGFMALVDYLPDVLRLIRAGVSVQSIIADPQLKEQANQLLSREEPIMLFKTSDGRYQTIDLESQRRVVIAKLFGVGSVVAKIGVTLNA